MAKKVKPKPVLPRPPAPPPPPAKPPEPEAKTESIPDNTIYGLRPWATPYVDTVGSSGGKAYGVDLYMGAATKDRHTVFGIAFGGQYSQFTSKLPELAGKSDSLRGASFFVDRREFSDTGRTFNRGLGGLGVGRYCPSVGDTCWAALYVNSSTSGGIQLSNDENNFGLSLSFDINSQTYLHLISDETRRQYSHPSQVFGLGLSLDFRFGTPSNGEAAGTALNTREILHEVIKYGLEDLGLFFGAKTSGDPLQKGKELLADAGQGETTAGPVTQPTATTNVSSLLALKAYIRAEANNTHLELFEKMDTDTRPAFFWGNVANTGLLLALSGDSDTMLGGGLSSLQHTINLLPILKEATPEMGYWVRVLTPHLMALGGLAASAGKRESFFATATEGWFATALHPGSSTGLLDARTYSYSVHTSTQTFDKGTLSGPMSEVAIENKLRLSGLSTRAAFASPVLSLRNRNVTSSLQNAASSAGLIEGNGAAYESPTLPTTASSMVGWRGSIGDEFYGTAAVFGGLAMALGPQSTPQLGVTGRASVGIGASFGDKNWLKIGAEGFVSKSVFSDSTTSDQGVAATITIRK